MKAEKILRPDAKGRVCLGALTEGVSGYKAVIDKKTKEITLKPYCEIPFSENWLFENASAFASVKKGLKQSLEPKTVSVNNLIEEPLDGLLNQITEQNLHSVAFNMDSKNLLDK